MEFVFRGSLLQIYQHPAYFVGLFWKRDPQNNGCCVLSVSFPTLPTPFAFCGSLLEKRPTKQGMLATSNARSSLPTSLFCGSLFQGCQCLFLFLMGLFFVGKETNKTWNVGNIKYDVVATKGCCQYILLCGSLFHCGSLFKKRPATKEYCQLMLYECCHSQ